MSRQLRTAHATLDALQKQNRGMLEDKPLNVGGKIKCSLFAFFVMWCLAALFSVGITGVVIWAIIKLVIHFTAH